MAKRRRFQADYRAGDERSNDDDAESEQVEKDVDRDYFLTAKETLAYGLIDRVLETKLGLAARTEGRSAAELSGALLASREGA